MLTCLGTLSIGCTVTLRNGTITKVGDFSKSSMNPEHGQGYTINFQNPIGGSNNWEYWPEFKGGYIKWASDAETYPLDIIAIDGVFSDEEVLLLL